jgi:hypothetical protein
VSYEVVRIMEIMHKHRLLSLVIMSFAPVSPILKHLAFQNRVPRRVFRHKDAEVNGKIEKVT